MPSYDVSGFEGERKSRQLVVTPSLSGLLIFVSIFTSPKMILQLGQNWIKSENLTPLVEEWNRRGVSFVSKDRPASS